MKAYTDYPFVSFGDEPYEDAPIRECKVLSYDNNKYCIIKINGSIKEVKLCYLYKRYGRYGAKNISIKNLKELKK